MAQAMLNDAQPESSPSAVCFRGVSFRSTKAFSVGTHRACAPDVTYELIKPWLKQAGVTRVADVTGLDHIGVPTTLAIRPNAPTMACSSGKGVTLDQAYVSGAMEAFELYAAETADLPSIRASYHELSTQHGMYPVSDLPLTRGSLFNPDWPLHWFIGWDLLTQSEVPVPLATVGMKRDDALLSSVGAFQVSSNGLGAGNSFLEAIAAGLYEVLERDGVACHYHAAQSADHMIPVLPTATLRQYPLVAQVLDLCDRAGVKVVVHDCTVETTVPTYEAIVYDSSDLGVGVVQGSGAHLDPEVAVLRAVTEGLQARLNFIAGSRDDIFRRAFARFRADWNRAVQAIEVMRAHSPEASLATSRASGTFEGDVNEILSCVRKAGLNHVIVADLTPPDFPIHVVRVLVPGLEGYMHHGYSPGRRAIAYATREMTT